MSRVWCLAMFVEVVFAVSAGSVAATKPAATGVDDWACRVAGDAWDMESRGDVGWSKGLVRKSFSDGRYRFSTRRGEFCLNLHGKLIEAARFSRLTYRIRADRQVRLRLRYFCAFSPFFAQDVAGAVRLAELQPGWNERVVDLAEASGGRGGWPGPGAYVERLGLEFQASRGGGAATIEVDRIGLESVEQGPLRPEIATSVGRYRGYDDELPGFDLSFVRRPEFVFAVIADTHIGHTASRNARQVRLVRQLNRLGPAFVIHLGDVVTSSPWHGRFKEQVGKSLEVLGQLRSPIYYVAGNHDIGNKPSFVLNKKKGFGNRGATTETVELFKKLFRVPNTYYSFDHAGRHFVVVDAMNLNVDGVFGGGQLAWLEADLAKHGSEQQTFVFSHIHPFYVHRDEPQAINYDCIDQPARDGIVRLCEEYGVDKVFCGHTHLLFFNRFGDTDVLTAPSTQFPRWARYGLSGPPNYKTGYYIVRVYDGSVVANLVRTPEPLPYPRQLQDGNSTEAAQIITESSVEHRFAAGGVQADLPREDLLAFSPSNLNDGMVRYPGMVGEEAVAGVCWSSQPSGNADETIEITFDLVEVATVVSVRLVAGEGLAMPGEVEVSSSRDGQSWCEVGAASGPAGESRVRTYRFEPRRARYVKLVLSGLQADLMRREQFSCGLAEVEIRDQGGRNVALRERGARVRATSNRTVRSSGVYNSNPIFGPEIRWQMLMDMGVNLVRFSPESVASRLAVRDGVVTLPPETLALLGEGVGKGLRYIVPLVVDPQLNDGVSFGDYVSYVVKQLGEPDYVIEVPADVFDLSSDDQQVDRAQRRGVIRAALEAGRSYIVGGLSLDSSERMAAGQGWQRASGLSFTVTGRSVVSAEIFARRLAELRGAAGRAEMPVYLVWKDGPKDPIEAGRTVAHWTIDAARRGYCNLWWHATRDSSPLFGFHRQEEPTVPFYTLRLLATLLQSAPEPASAADVRAVGTDAVVLLTCRGAGCTRLVLVCGRAGAGQCRFDLEVPEATGSAKLIDLPACTSQVARLEEGDGCKVLPGLVGNGGVMVVALTNR